MLYLSFIAVLADNVMLNSDLTLDDAIVLVAGVNGRLLCSIREQFHIKATVTSSKGDVVSTRTVGFSNDPIFIPVPSGSYMCSVEVVTANNVTLESRSVRCSTKPESQLFFIVTISLSVSTFVAMLVGFASGMLAALWCGIKRRKKRKSNKKLSANTEKISSGTKKTPDPHYEELPKQTRNSIPLEANIAYGQNSVGRHSLAAISYCSESHTLV